MRACLKCGSHVDKHICFEVEHVAYTKSFLGGVDFEQSVRGLGGVCPANIAHAHAIGFAGFEA